MTNWITRIEGNERQVNSASGYIANRDSAYFAQQIGFKPLSYKRISPEVKGESEQRALAKQFIANVEPEDLVVIQFPTWNNSITYERFLIEELKNKHVKVALLMWDILSWLHEDIASNRDMTNDHSFKMMRLADYVLSPNETMTARLQSEGKIKTPIGSLGLWDYRMEYPLDTKKFEKKVTFIGTLDKTDFSRYQGQTPLYLIGSTAGLTNEEKEKSQLIQLGQIENNQIAQHLDGGFGIVSYDNPNQVKSRFKGAEKYGHYNNPLKLSQYIAAGLPVIVDSSSAHAKRIFDENIGLVIDGLDAIDTVLEVISEKEYRVMAQNVLRYSEKVREGYFLKNALKGMIAYFKKEIEVY
jgi:hypothetical protein